MANALERTVLREGLREYFNPYTGTGLGATDFAWSALMMELTDPVPEAARSYL
jgi:hypothetical protein